MEKATLEPHSKLDNLLVFSARYHHFRFTRHSHDEFALGYMYQGVQQFYCRGTNQSAPAGSLITVNPGEIHDGMSADDSIFCYRILYLPYSLLQDIGREMLGIRDSLFFTEPILEDPALATELARLFWLMDEDDTEVLQLQELLYNLLEKLLSRHGTEQQRLGRQPMISDKIAKAISFIHDSIHDEISLDDIAKTAGLSRYHFLRSFNQEMSISPYAYLLQCRLEFARQVIGTGRAIGDAAYEAGFSDQSHLSRRFKAAYGITPKQYQRAVCSRYRQRRFRQ